MAGKSRQGIFRSKWITTDRFRVLEPLEVFHKELDGRMIGKSPVQNDHVHFRKKFHLKDCQEVRIRISADDYYKLYVNGIYVCQGPAPGYADAYRYNEVDLTSYVKKGENILAVHVYYQGLVNRVWNSGDNRQGMIADLFQGREYLGGTDHSWVYGQAMEYTGEPIGYETAFAEHIDFIKKERDWKETSFDDSHYRPAVELDGDDHVFEDNPTECITVYQVKPLKIMKKNGTGYLLDFGREYVGQFSMVCQGEKGQKVRIQCGEELDEGNPQAVRYDMRCNCRYQEECILSGGRDELEYYDYKAFRYVNIVTDRDNLDPDSFCLLARNHRFRQRCFLETDIPHLQEIWELCVHTLRCGVQEGFLDCPTREKGQYLGDFTVSGLAYLYLTGDREIYRKTLVDFARSGKVCKGLLAVAPGSFMQEIADFSLQYPLQVWHYYRYTGDRDTLEELYPTVCGVMEYFADYEREDGLLVAVDEKWNLVDWPKNLRDDYEIGGEDRETPNPCHNVLNAFYIGAIQAFDQIRQVLGMPACGKEKRVTAAYLSAFYDSRKRLFADTQQKNHFALHSNVLPAVFRIAPVESLENIKDMILEKGLCCGTQFSYFVLKALAAVGAYEEELELLVNETEHSWVNMLRQGATTCFETWGKEQKWNTSLCHPWSCAPVIVILEDMAGVGSEERKGGEASWKGRRGSLKIVFR